MARTIPNFCFCMDLRTGSFVIGCVNLAWGIIASIVFAILLNSAMRWSPSSLVAIYAVNLSLSIIRVIFTCVLLVGIHQYNRPYVKAFLVYGAVSTVLTLALFITSLVLYSIDLDAIINIVDLVLIVYFLLVIRSYYLSDSSKAPQYPVIGPHFVVQQPQFVLQQQPQLVITQRQTPQYVMPQQQNVVQQEPPPMYSKE